MTENENEELCLLVGFKRYGSMGDREQHVFTLLDPNGKRVQTNTLPDLFSDLNALDKWVVPVLRERGLVEIVCLYSLGSIEAILSTVEGYCYKDRIRSTAATEAAARASAALKFLKGK